MQTKAMIDRYLKTKILNFNLNTSVINHNKCELIYFTHYKTENTVIMLVL